MTVFNYVLTCSIIQGENIFSVLLHDIDKLMYLFYYIYGLSADAINSSCHGVLNGRKSTE
jgi:hypothetical protein